MATRDHLDQVSGHHQPPPDLIGGRYRSLQRIGESRVAITYRARDIGCGRTVALKLFSPEYADLTALTRWEVSAEAAIEHPNVVQVSDYGVHEGQCYVVRQYVADRTLRQFIDEQGPLAPAAAMEIVRQMLRGLSAIHAAGVVHRHLTPQNILVGDDGLVRVSDFGILSGRSGEDPASNRIDAATAAYLAPEQIRGDPISPSTDLYAVGVVLFELLTGRPPFEFNHPEEVIRAHLHQPPPAMSQFMGSIPPAFDAAILRTLAKDPADRYTSAADMARALDAETSPQQAHQHFPDKPSLDSDWQVALVIVVLALALLVGALATTLGGGSEVQSENGTRPPDNQAASRADFDLLSSSPVATSTPRVIRSPTPTGPLPTPTTKLRPSRTPTPPKEPTSTVAVMHQDQAVPTVLRFSAADWQGGSFHDEWYGRAWTTVYGSQSPYPSATLTFSLTAVPNTPAKLTITGLDDEWAGTNPITITVDGVEIFSAPCPFASWDGVSQGVQAAWTPIAFTVPEGLLHEGKNEISLANDAQSASSSSPPWILVSDAVLEIGS
jgi:eukaryotic-like serine/threonine-protein kinase